jgi:cytochrome c-type biogenesis protein CcmH
VTKRRALLSGLAAALVVAALVAIWSFTLFATPPQETLDQRVHDVASQLKCPVCQGESVADSPALISQQMRALIRQQLQSGMSEQQVIQYFRSRYGDSILWAPPQQGFTLLAWIVPPAVLMLGALIVLLVLRAWGRAKHNGAVPTEASREVEDELMRFQAQLERELAAEDTLFAPQVKEAS